MARNRYLFAAREANGYPPSETSRQAPTPRRRGPLILEFKRESVRLFHPSRTSFVSWLLFIVLAGLSYAGLLIATRLAFPGPLPTWTLPLPFILFAPWLALVFRLGLRVAIVRPSRTAELVILEVFPQALAPYIRVVGAGQERFLKVQTTYRRLIRALGLSGVSPRTAR